MGDYVKCSCHKIELSVQKTARVDALEFRFIAIGTNSGILIDTRRVSRLADMR